MYLMENLEKGYLNKLTVIAPLAKNYATASSKSPSESEPPFNSIDCRSQITDAVADMRR